MEELAGRRRSDYLTLVIDPDSLRQCTLDYEFDQSGHFGRYPRLSNDYWVFVKAMRPGGDGTGDGVDPDALGERRKVVFDAVMGVHQRIVADGIDWGERLSRQRQLLLNLDGKARKASTTQPESSLHTPIRRTSPEYLRQSSARLLL